MKTIRQLVGLLACAVCLFGVLLLFSAGAVEGDLPKLAAASILTVVGAVIVVWLQLRQDSHLHHHD